MEYNGLPMTAEEKIRFLEQCLDNKEKVNKQLRKDIKWYEKEEDRLREENKKLKEKIDKLEKELSAVYKAYHTALGTDKEEDLYDLDT